MKENETHIIYSLQNRWQSIGILVQAIVALAVALLIVAIAHVWKGASFWWILLAWPVCTACLLLLYGKWRILNSDVVKHLNSFYPQLEASTNLLLKPAVERSFLENLQIDKINGSLSSIEIKNPLLKRMRGAVLFLLVAIAISFSIAFIHVSFKNGNSKTAAKSDAIGQKMLPGIKAVSVIIEPPAYTKKDKIKQTLLNIVAPEDAVVDWKLTTNVAMSDVEMVFDDSIIVKLAPVNKDQNSWTLKRTIVKAGFYQVKLNGQLSDLYKIEMIKDQPPVIVVQSPKPSTVIDYGEQPVVKVIASVTDDYSVAQRFIMATVASGSGEAVKFKEQKIEFNEPASGQKTDNIQQHISLQSLGMHPGDELYFYISATDNHRQESRSDIYIVTLADTAQLMSLDITINASDIKPEFFRSERQIIIETEQLLRDKDTLSESSFKNRSNELGIDQKLLRLRYGKFLGEESEGNIGEAHEEDNTHSHQETVQFGNANEILDEFTHKHDIAEDATFFDPETKKLLKATLAEMWNAELRLRTYKPSEALPFAYKALRLLKDLQQKSRVYVGKTSIKTPPLQKEKRLSGDLSKIGSPKYQDKKQTTTSDEEVLRQSLSLLEEIKTNLVVSSDEIAILQRAATALGTHAANNPAVFMQSLQAIRNIISNLTNNKAVNSDDILAVQKALYKVIPASLPLPRRGNKSNDLSLSETYFNNLQKTQP